MRVSCSSYKKSELYQIRDVCGSAAVVNVESVTRVTYFGEVGFFFGSLSDMSDFQYGYIDTDVCILELVVTYVDMSESIAKQCASLLTDLYSCLRLHRHILRPLSTPYVHVSVADALKILTDALVA